MHFNKHLPILIVALALFSTEAHGQDSQDQGVKFRAVGELGFLSSLSHRIQFGQQGTSFDYVNEGGQDTLYFISRGSLELELNQRHTIILLYQPLSLVTSEVLTRDLVVDDLTFPSGTPMQYTYDFPFYRASYLYDLAPDPRLELAVGGSLQIRNAVISFVSLDGKLERSNRNVGLVPELKARISYTWDSGFWLGSEIDGMYAPVSYINGDDNGVVGAIIDASARAGFNLNERAGVFLNLRYLAGGARGTSDNPSEFGDGYTNNWLHFLTVTSGLVLSL